MPNFVIHNLWPSPVYQNIIQVKQKWIDYAKSVEYIKMHSNNGNISVNKYILENIMDLKADIIYHSELYFRNFLKIKDNTSFYITNSWLNNHKQNDYAQPHCHKNSIFSGVYYLSLPKEINKCGCLSFEKGYFNNIGVAPSTFHFEFEEHNNITADTYKIIPQNGMIVIFPSHLYHSVDVNDTNDDRISLAFNFFAKGLIGKEEYELELI
jgi:uncharacterized protein (TIGR02466 family)